MSITAARELKEERNNYHAYTKRISAGIFFFIYDKSGIVYKKMIDYSSENVKL